MISELDVKDNVYQKLNMNEEQLRELIDTQCSEDPDRDELYKTFSKNNVDYLIIFYRSDLSVGIYTSLDDCNYDTIPLAECMEDPFGDDAVRVYKDLLKVRAIMELRSYDVYALVTFN